MKITILIILLISSLELFGKTYPKQEFGIEISTMNGYGLAYQLEFSTDIAAKLTFGAYYTAEEPPDDLSIYGAISAQFQYNFLKSENTRPYIFSSMGHTYLENRSKNTTYENDRKITIKNREIDKIFNFNLGLGYELKLFENVSFTFELGLQHQLSDPSDISNLFDRNPSGTQFTGLGAGIGLRYIYK